MGDTIHIFHFDDEPAKVAFIPEAMMNQYWLADANCINENDIAEQDEEALIEFAFTVRKGGSHYRIVYRIYSDPERFEGDFKTQPVNIVMMDLIAEMPHGELRPIGVEHYKLVRQSLPREDIFFLTAYPRAFEELLSGETRGEALLTKPIDAMVVSELLMNRIKALGHGA